MLKKCYMRKAVSTMIGGIIVLTLLLTALGTMVFVSQQYDSYQSVVDQMSQYDVQRFSENLVANYPALIPPTGSGACGSSTCYEYTMSLSNVGGLTNAGSSNSGISGGSGGGIGVQIIRIYINSTGSSGCLPPNPCIINPANAATPYGFRTSDSFLNPGEFSHNVLFWIPSSIGMLPNPSPPTPQNTIWIVTSRGRVFSFQWPFPPTGSALGGQSGAAVSAGVMKVAYQGDQAGYNSANEGSTYPNAPYCHAETSAPYPAGPGYKEVLTGITGITGNSLTFVNPWITNQILNSAYDGHTTLYVYASVINSVQKPFQVKGGNLVISTATSGANSKQYFIGGGLFGIYYTGTFYASPNSPTIQPNEPFYAIFKIEGFTQNIFQESAGHAFTGTASMTNQALDQTYFSGEVVLDGLYIRTSCTTP